MLCYSPECDEAEAVGNGEHVTYALEFSRLVDIQFGRLNRNLCSLPVYLSVFRNERLKPAETHLTRAAC